MIITLEQLKAVYPAATEAQLKDLDAVCRKYNITTPRRFQYFMAQAYSETQGFTSFVENLFYTTPSRLVAVWPSRFYFGTPVAGKLNAEEYVRNPQKLANAVYSNRMGNGAPESNDGWNFIGRGAGHLTGKDNYSRASTALTGTDVLVQNPDLVASDYMFSSFGWFWDVNKLNPLADADEFTRCTAVINGASGKRLTEVVQERLPNLRRMKQAFPTINI